MRRNPTVTTDVGRHLAIQHFRIRDQVRDGVIELAGIATSIQLADALTKPLDRLIFQRLQPSLMGRPPPVHM